MPKRIFSFKVPAKYADSYIRKAETHARRRANQEGLSLEDLNRKVVLIKGYIHFRWTYDPRAWNRHGR